MFDFVIIFANLVLLYALGFWRAKKIIIINLATGGIVVVVAAAVAVVVVAAAAAAAFVVGAATLASHNHTQIHQHTESGGHVVVCASGECICVSRRCVCVCVVVLSKKIFLCNFIYVHIYI